MTRFLISNLAFVLLAVGLLLILILILNAIWQHRAPVRAARSAARRAERERVHAARATALGRVYDPAPIPPATGRHRAPSAQVPAQAVDSPRTVTLTAVSAPPPPPNTYYARLRASADAREAAEATVSTGATAVGAVQTAVAPAADKPPYQPVPDRTVHAYLADGSEIVRYERAGKWFHEGPGVRRRVTLGEAAELAATPGTLLLPGGPGGAVFDNRVLRLKERQP